MKKETVADHLLDVKANIVRTLIAQIRFFLPFIGLCTISDSRDIGFIANESNTNCVLIISIYPLVIRNSEAQNKIFMPPPLFPIVNYDNMRLF